MSPESLTPVPLLTYALDPSSRGPLKHPPNEVKETRPSLVEEAEVTRLRHCRTSVLDRMCGSLCEVISGGSQLARIKAVYRKLKVSSGSEAVVSMRGLGLHAV